MGHSSFSIHIESFGNVEGADVKVIKITNGWMAVTISNYGCTVTSIEVPDKLGRRKNIVAALNTMEEYLNDPYCLGCIVGRYANRIAYGKFSISGEQYQLSVNEQLNHLHGGFNGFNKKIWSIETIIEEEDKAGVVFLCLSEDREEGYPGNLKTTTTYLLNKTNELSINMEAITDKPTIINLTNHTYFNLSGFEETHIFNHFLKINAETYTEKNEQNVPNGHIVPVANSALDFSTGKLLGTDIELLRRDMGYDHNFVINGTGVRPAAEFWHPASGRALNILTDQPGLQLYTANFWDGSLVGQQGVVYRKHGAVALETQAFPDSPNHDNFPNTVLMPEEKYQTQTIFRFFVR
jgi:aldose 1-epimerase